MERIAIISVVLYFTKVVHSITKVIIKEYFSLSPQRLPIFFITTL